MELGVHIVDGLVLGDTLFDLDLALDQVELIARHHGAISMHGLTDGELDVTAVMFLHGCFDVRYFFEAILIVPHEVLKLPQEHTAGLAVGRQVIIRGPLFNIDRLLDQLLFRRILNSLTRFWLPFLFYFLILFVASATTLISPAIRLVILRLSVFLPDSISVAIARLRDLG